MNATKYIVVFCVTFISDWIWAYYIQHTAQKNAIKSSLFSGLVVICSVFITTSYIHDIYAAIPAVIGGMLGTYVSVKFSKDKNDNT